MSSKNKETAPKEEQPIEETPVEEAPEAMVEEVSETDALRAELESAQNDLAAEKDKNLRLRAEYDNFRKRSARERDNIYADVKADTLKKLLPIFDNLERALRQETADEAYKKGVKMTMTQFLEALQALGVTPIDCVGKEFDPERHNAVMHIEDESLGENVVAQVFQAGFDLTMVGLDVTQKVRLTTDHVAILDKYAAPENRPIVDYLKQALPFYFRFNRLQNNCLDHCPVHDPLAMLAAVDPSVVTVRTIPARVECGGSFCRGMVVADLREHPIEAPGVSICVDVDSRRALEELLTTFMA